MSRFLRNAPRRAWNAVILLSLLGCGAACVLWARSYVAQDMILWRRADGARWLRSAPGALVFGWELSDGSGTSERLRGLKYARRPPDPEESDLLRMYVLSVTPGDTYVVRDWGGFAWGNWQAAGKGSAIGRSIVPLWSVAAATALLPVVRSALYFRSRARRRRRALQGLCASCAYDLTGNESGVCPECGKAADKAPL